MTKKEQIQKLTKEELKILLNNNHSYSQLLKKLFKNEKYILKRTDKNILIFKFKIFNLNYDKLINSGLKQGVISKLGSIEFKKIVENSQTITEILSFFGMPNQGSNFKTLKRRFEAEGLDWEDFKKKNKNKRRNILPNDKLFIENSRTSRGVVKKRILDQNLIKYECDICGKDPFYRGMPLVLILDHKNGVNNDHRLINLRFTCPYCDSQLDTCGSKNRKGNGKAKIPTSEEIDLKINELNMKKEDYNKKYINKKIIKGKLIKKDKRKCLSCQKKISLKNKSGLCITCLQEDNLSKINYERIKEEVLSIGYEATGKLYGITGNGIKKRLQRKGEIPKISSSKEEKYNILQDFIDEFGRLPLCKDKEYRILQRFRDPDIKNKLSKKEIEKLNNLNRWILNPEERAIDEWNQKFNLAKDWCIKNKRYPKNTQKDIEEKRISNWLGKNNKREEIKYLIKTYRN